MSPRELVHYTARYADRPEAAANSFTVTLPAMSEEQEEQPGKREPQLRRRSKWGR